MCEFGVAGQKIIDDSVNLATSTSLSVRLLFRESKKMAAGTAASNFSCPF